MDIARVISRRSLVPGLITLILLILLATLPLYAPPYTPILLTSIFMYIVLTVSWAIFSSPTSYISFMLVLMAIFGGMGQLYGPIIGAAVFAYLREFLTTEFPYYYMLIFGIIMVVVILYLPNGLAGLVQKWRRRGSAGQQADI